MASNTLAFKDAFICALKDDDDAAALEALNTWQSKIDSRLDWDPEPDTIHPLVIPDLVDADCPQMVYRWVRGEVRGCQVVPQPCGQELLLLTDDNKIPWWSNAIDIEDLIGSSRGLYGSSFMNWMLEEGLAPGQPFLIAIPEPDRGCYYGEYEEEWSFDVVRKMSHALDKAARSWSRCIQRLSERQAKQEAFKKALLERAWQSHNTWTLRAIFRTWHTPADYQVSLRSVLEGHVTILCEEAGPQKEAVFSRLLSQVRKNRPSLDLVILTKQVPEWYRPTVWELLDFGSSP